MLARRSGVDYSQGIYFQTGLINTEEAKELTMNNHQKRCRCGSIKHLQISSKDCPFGLVIRKAKKSAMEMALSKSEAKKANGYAAAAEESNCLAAEAAREGG